MRQIFEVKFASENMTPQLAAEALAGVIDGLLAGQSRGSASVGSDCASWFTLNDPKAEHEAWKATHKAIVYHTKDLDTVIQLMREGWRMLEEAYMGRFNSNPVTRLFPPLFPLHHAPREQNRTVARPAFDKLVKANQIAPVRSKDHHAGGTWYTLVSANTEKSDA